MYRHLVCCFLPLFATAFSHGADESLTLRLRNEAPIAWSRAEAHYSCAEIEATFQEEPRGTARRIHCLTSPGLFLSNERTLRAPSNVKSFPSSILRAHNTRYSFFLTRQAESDPWLIRRTQKVVSGSAGDQERALASEELAPYLTAHYCIWNIPLKKFFSHSAVTIKSTELLQQGDARFIDVTFECNSPDPETMLKFLRHGKVRLAPDENWCIQHVELDLDLGFAEKQTYTVLYSKKGDQFHDQFLIPKQVTRTITNKRSAERMVFSYTKYVRRMVDEAEITLTAHGLPEVLGARPE